MRARACGRGHPETTDLLLIRGTALPTAGEGYTGTGIPRSPGYQTLPLTFSEHTAPQGGPGVSSPKRPCRRLAAAHGQRQRLEGQRAAGRRRERGGQVPFPSCSRRASRHGHGEGRDAAAGPYLLSSLLCASAPCWTSLSRTSAGEVEGG